MLYGQGSRTDPDKEYLERENERLREEARRRETDEERRRDERRREQKEAISQARHEASTWEEAFSKNLSLLERELAEERAMVEKYKDTDEPWPHDDSEFWLSRIACNKRGAELWREARKRIDAARREAANAVADQLLKEFPKEALDMERPLRDDDPSELLNW